MVNSKLFSVYDETKVKYENDLNNSINQASKIISSYGRGLNYDNNSIGVRSISPLGNLSHESPHPAPPPPQHKPRHHVNFQEPLTSHHDEPPSNRAIYKVHAVPVTTTACDGDAVDERYQSASFKDSVIYDNDVSATPDNFYQKNSQPNSYFYARAEEMDGRVNSAKRALYNNTNGAVMGITANYKYKNYPYGPSGSVDLTPKPYMSVSSAPSNLIGPVAYGNQASRPGVAAPYKPYSSYSPVVASNSVQLPVSRQEASKITPASTTIRTSTSIYSPPQPSSSPAGKYERREAPLAPGIYKETNSVVSSTDKSKMMTTTTTTTTLSRSQSRSRSASRSRSESKSASNSKSPTLHIDLEINTPGSDTRASRKCNNYEVSPNPFPVPVQRVPNPRAVNSDRPAPIKPLEAHFTTCF